MDAYCEKDLIQECQSLLLMGKISEARHLLSSQKPTESENAPNFAFSMDLKIPNLPLANAFIEGYLALGGNASIGTAKDLLISMGCRADALSYALFIRHYLRRKDFSGVRLIIIEMHKRTFLKMEQIYDTKLFNQNSIEILKKLAGLYDLNHQNGGIGAYLNGREDEGTEEFIPVNNNYENTDNTGVPRKEQINLPLVDPIASKGGGINFIKGSIASLMNSSESKIKSNLQQIQKKLERDCLKSAVDHLKQQWQSLQLNSNKPANVVGSKWILATWAFKLATAIRENITKKSPRPSNLQILDSILSILEAEKIALIILQELLKMGRYSFDLGTGGGGGSTLWPGCNYTFLCGDIGKSIEQELFAEQISQNAHVARYYRASSSKGAAESQTDNGAITLRELSLKSKIARDLMHSRTRSHTINEIQRVMGRDEDAKAKGWLNKFTPELRYEVGAYCLDMALQNLTTFSENESEWFGTKPFIHQIVKNPNDFSKKLGIVRMDRKLFDRFSEPTGELIENLGVQPWTLPMISPPNPWGSLSRGGYYSFQTDCVRYRDDPSHWALLVQADQAGDLNRLYDALNYLGTTPWTINERVLRVALTLWNKGFDVSNLNSATSVPSFEEYLYGDFPPIYRRKEEFSSHEEYCAFVTRTLSQKKAMTNSHSMRCETNYKLELARAYCGLTFYFPHNVDFRGRAYPIPPHLNHLGSDLSRGLLLFAEGKQLGGEIGLNWLKVQLANMKGKDKLPLRERIAFVNSVIDKVQAVAADPLGSEKDFWQKAEEPWQSLAACFEIAEALGDPVNFQSRLPVQQDGSCNGSQHYAALGGDVWGASQVNLLPSDRPQDIYATVASLVQEYLDKLAETDPFSAKVKSMVPVTRKIVKTPVMTNVYGVTNYGAKKQIASNIKEIHGDGYLGNEVGKASALLANLVFKALDGLFVQARRIQDWLAKAAEEIGKARCTDNPNEKFGSLVTWTSPMGFPVIQPYHKQNNVHLRTAVQTITLTCPDSERIDSAKQAAGFPPNFIHSLDASHMFMTGERCKRQGITFASVHDCFWTHAATVPIMNEQLRLAFIELHSQPILENLRNELIERYKGYVVKKGNENPRPIYFSPIPVKGPLDISQVKDSIYFFS